MFNKISIRSSLKPKQFFILLNQMLPFQMYFISLFKKGKKV